MMPAPASTRLAISVPGCCHRLVGVQARLPTLGRWADREGGESPIAYPMNRHIHEFQD